MLLCVISLSKVGGQQKLLKLNIASCFVYMKFSFLFKSRFEFKLWGVENSKCRLSYKIHYLFFYMSRINKLHKQKK